MSGSNRSVSARDITGSSIVTGDHNTVSTTMKQVALPPADHVDVKRKPPNPSPIKRRSAARSSERSNMRRRRTISASTPLPRLAALASWLGANGHNLLAMLGISP
jgi:hypothetical protein